MLQHTPTTGHVVTFPFQFLRVNKEKRIHKCEITVDKKVYSESEPHVDLHILRKSKSVTLCPVLPYTHIVGYLL